MQRNYTPSSQTVKAPNPLRCITCHALERAVADLEQALQLQHHARERGQRVLGRFAGGGLRCEVGRRRRHLEQNAAAGSDRGVLQGLLCAHAAHNFNCQRNVTANELHDISRLQLVPLHSEQQRQHQRVERAELRAVVLARLLLLPQQLLKSVRQARQAVEDAVAGIVVACQRAEQRERRLLGLDSDRFGGSIQVGDASVHHALEHRRVRGQRLDVGGIVAIDAGIRHSTRRFAHFLPNRHELSTGRARTTLSCRPCFTAAAAAAIYIQIELLLRRRRSCDRRYTSDWDWTYFQNCNMVVILNLPARDQPQAT